MKYIVQPVLPDSAFVPGTIPDAQNKRYVITSINSGKVMSVRNGDIVLEQRNWTEDDRQQWRIEPLSGNDRGYFRIVSARTGNVLDVWEGSTADGARIVEHPWHGGPNQQWAIQKIGSEWAIRPNVAQYGGAEADWSKMVRRESGLTVEAAKRIADQDPNITFFFFMKGGQMVLPKGVFRQGDAVFFSGSPWYGSAVGLADAYEKVASKKAEYKIVSRSSGKVLDVSGVSVDQGALIHQWTWQNTLNQVWQLSTLAEIQSAYAFDARTTIYEHANYAGRSQTLGVGSYDINDLAIGNDSLSSLRVPQGLRVTLYEHANFRGNSRTYIGDTAFVGNDFNDKTSAILVEKVVTIYEHGNYQGRSFPLGIGVYKYDVLRQVFGNDILSSLRVPLGMMVILYEHDLDGRYRIFTESTGWVGDDFNDITSSIIVKAIGVEIPQGALEYGDKVVMRSHHNQHLTASPNGAIGANVPHIDIWEEFVITRSGPTRYQNYVSYGDTVSLKSVHNKYVVAESDGRANANRDSITAGEKFTILRSGDSLSKIFVTIGDIISLKSVYGKYVVAESNGQVNANRDAVGPWEKWVIRTRTAERGTYTSTDGTPGAAQPASICGAQACGSDVCGADACGADACGAAACGAAGSLVGVCGVAAGAIAICGADVCAVAVGYAQATGIGVCGADATGIGACGVDVCGAAATGVGACGAAVSGFAACGADVCGGAACGAAACGAAACGAAACGVDADLIAACTSDADVIGISVADVCAAEAGVIDACAADACAANVCAINLCPADACAADACAIDVIPIIPGI